MNDEDLRDLFAGMALMGNLASDKEAIVDTKACAEYCYDLADAMIEAKYAVKESEMGITAAKPKRKRSANVSAANS
jgi:hypothetical protein